MSKYVGTRMFEFVTETWNPVIGCKHYCCYCWSRRLVETRLKRIYRDFTPRLIEKRFRYRPKAGSLVFVCDMGDLFGDWVPREWITRVINFTKSFPETTFLFLTKNPARYIEFIDEFPSNVILGTTIETDRDDLYRKYHISRAPLPSERYRAMLEVKDRRPELRRFVSIEPILDFNLGTFVKWIKDVEPCMVAIGYDNYSNKLPEPPLGKTLKLIDELEKVTKVAVSYTHLTLPTN